MEGRRHTLSPPPDPRTTDPLMTDDSTPLGYFPTCEREIGGAWKLIEYQQSDGGTGIFAECPPCDDGVTPRQADAG